MNVRHPMGVLHSFSIKNIFYDKMDLRLFYFHVTTYKKSLQINTQDFSLSLVQLSKATFTDVFNCDFQEPGKLNR